MNMVRLLINCACFKCHNLPFIKTKIRPRKPLIHFCSTFKMCIRDSTAGDAYDMRPISIKLKELESKNIPVAYLGKYSGIFNFLGRLKQSPELIRENTVPAWFAAHPNGRIIKYFDKATEINQQQVEFMQAYKDVKIAILNYQQWQAKIIMPSSAQAE